MKEGVASVCSKFSCKHTLQKIASLELRNKAFWCVGGCCTASKYFPRIKIKNTLYLIKITVFVILQKSSS